MKSCAVFEEYEMCKILSKECTNFQITIKLWDLQHTNVKILYFHNALLLIVLQQHLQRAFTSRDVKQVLYHKCCKISVHTFYCLMFYHVAHPLICCCMKPCMYVIFILSNPLKGAMKDKG